MSQVVKIDIPTGHEEKLVICILIYRLFFIAYLSKPMHFLKTCTVNYESIAYRETKFC